MEQENKATEKVMSVEKAKCEVCNGTNVHYKNGCLDCKEKAPKEYIEDESLPEFIKKIDEFSYEVTTKEGIFIMEDVPEKKIKQARSKCTNPQTGQINTANLEYALISASLIEPKKGELDLLEYRGSTIQRLKFAVYKLYDMESFLSIQRS